MNYLKVNHLKRVDFTHFLKTKILQKQTDVKDESRTLFIANIEDT